MTDPVTAARAALGALKVRRIALLTPYVRRINESLRAALCARGMEIPVMGSFNQEDDNVVARIAPQSIADAIIGLGASDACDGVFVSCTSLRVARIVEEVEAKLGKPVTSLDQCRSPGTCCASPDIRRRSRTEAGCFRSRLLLGRVVVE